MDNNPMGIGEWLHVNLFSEGMFTFSFGATAMAPAASGMQVPAPRNPLAHCMGMHL